MKLSKISKESTMSSREIAELCEKRHDNVMADIRKMLSELGLHAPDFSGTYKSGRGNEYECFNLPRRECDILISGYSIKYRAAIVDRWRELEFSTSQKQFRVAERMAARLQPPELNAAVADNRKAEGKELKPHLFSNEYNMINRIVLGLTAKQYAAEHGLKPSDPIRDTMRPAEMAAIADLQRTNTGLINMGLPYQERKVMLQQLFNRKHRQALIDEILLIEG